VFCRKSIQKSAEKKCKGTLDDLKEKKDLKEQPKPILKIK